MEAANDSKIKKPSARSHVAGKGGRETLLVTGAGGALGRRVVTRLKDDYNVVGVDFRWRKNLDPDIVHYEVDFNKRSFEDVFREHEFAGILHLGRIIASEMTRPRRYDSNVLGAQRLFQLGVKYGVSRVLVLSTHFVYGAHPLNPALLDEDAPLKASSVTGELVDSVETESLASIFLYKHPETSVIILRPCNILGPDVHNALSRLLTQEYAPYLAGFSPMMQFLHVSDMADAVVLAFKKDVRGVFNVAPDDWIGLQDAMELCGCTKLPLPSIPPLLPKMLTTVFGRWSYPSYLINYLKYPVVIDGSAFRETFGFRPKRSLDEIFEYYRREKAKAKVA
ncbi:MAG: SDR family oxidoreductase [Nevskiales bacterium]